MKKNMMDRLIEKIKQTNNPTVIGLDPRYEIIPNCVKSKYTKDLSGYAKASVEFCNSLIDSTYDIIPAVKLQLAYFEMLGPEGLKAFQEVKNYAVSKGMIVMVDANRAHI